MMEKARILIVEDEAIIAMGLKGNLQSLGYEVTSIVNTGDKAIEKAEEDKPDLILMDIRIKGEMDGIDTAEVIRNRFGIPVIFSTAYLDQERIERAKITMPFGYVLKPIQERDLKVTLEMALYVAKADIKRKRIEDDLRSSERRFQLAMDATSDGLFDWNIKTNEIYFNPGYFTMLGYGANELPSTFESYQSLLHPEDAIRTEDNLKNFLASDVSNNSIEIRLKSKSNDWIWVLSRGKIVEHDEDGNPSRMVGINININERKRDEELLRFEKDRKNQYLDVAGVLLIALDVSGNVTLINPKGCEILGYKQSDIIGRNWFDDLLPSEEINVVKKVFAQIMKGDIAPVEYYENPIKRKDGSERFIAWHNSILRDSSGHIIGLFSSGEDITKRKKAEENLIHSEQILREVINSMEKAIAIYEAVDNGEDFRFVDMNEFGEKITHFKIEDVLGKTIKELFPEESSIGLIEKLKETYLTGKSTNIPLKQYQDDRITQRVENYIFKLPSGKVVAMFEDTTEKRKEDS